MTKTCTGICSVTGEETTLEVRYTRVPILGSIAGHYKATGHDCPRFDCTESICSIVMANIQC
jgi:hypothetical protein